VSLPQFVILSKRPSNNNGLAPLGQRNEILRDLSRFNTAPERDGDDVLYGPGIRLELPPGQDVIDQILMTINEEEIAWLVIMRLAKSFDWKIIDTNSGRELNG
jgi:hypothetical protein